MSKDRLKIAIAWVTGIVGVIAADDPGLSDDDVERIAQRVAELRGHDA